MRKVAYSLLVLALLLTLVLGLPRARADGSLTFDYTSGDQGASAVGVMDLSYGPFTATWQNGQGWIMDTSVRAGEAYGRFDQPLGTSYNIASIDVTYVASCSSSPTGSYIQLLVNGSSYQYGDSSNPLLTCDGSPHTQALVIDKSSDTVSVLLYIWRNGATVSVRITQIVIHWTAGGPTPTYTFTPTPTITPTPGPGPTGGCTTTWTITHDFTQDHFGWEPRTLNPLEATRNETGYHSRASLIEEGSYSQRAVIQKIFKAGTITSIDLDVTYNPGAAGSGGRQLKVIDTTNNATLIDGGLPPSAGQRVYSWSGDRSGAITLQINVWASGVVSSADEATGDATINSIKITGSGYDPDGSCTPSPITPNNENWAYPISASGRLARYAINYIIPPFEAISGGLDGLTQQQLEKSAIIAYSSKGDVVHSLINGTVSDIQLVEANRPVCTVSLPRLLTEGRPPYTCTENITGLDGTRYHSLPLALYYKDAYVIKVQIDNAFLYYVVADPNVRINQSVEKGCILGKALAIFIPPDVAGIIDVLRGQSVSGAQYKQANETYTIIMGRNTNNTPFDLAPYLKEEPLDKYCGSASQVEDGCALTNNSIFKKPASSGWSLNPDSSGNAPDNPPGADTGLLLTGIAQQTLNLDPTHQYTINILGSVLNPSRPVGDAHDATISFTVRLGTNPATTLKFDSAISSQQQVSVPAATYTANRTDAGNWFDLILQGSPQNGSTIILESVCVADTAEAPPLPSGGCILLNPEFDNSSATSRIWTPTNSEYGTVSFGNGLVIIPSGANIQQSLTLSPKQSGPQEYKISIIGRRQGSEVNEQSITVSWQWSTAGSILSPALVNPQWKTLTDTFTVSAKTTSNLVVYSNATPSTIMLQLDRVCITTNDDADVPGYQPPPPITASCKVCSYAPVGDINVDLVEMIQWLECAISQIWHCQAKTILYGIWKVLVDILTFLGFLRIWLNATILTIATWVNSNIQVIMRYFNALFRNLGTEITNAIAYGPSSTTIITESGGAGLFDFLIALVNGIRDLGSTIVNGIVSAIRDFRDVFLLLINSVFTLIVLIIQLVVALINLVVTFIFTILGNLLSVAQIAIQSVTSGFNAQTSMPVTLSCGESGSGVYYVCVIAYLLEQYVFSDPTVSVVVNIAIGAMAFYLLVWAVDQLSGALS